MKQNAKTTDLQAPSESWSPINFDYKLKTHSDDDMVRNFELSSSEALAEIIPELYRIQANSTEENFRQAILPLFKKYIRFDAGWMAVSAVAPEGPIFKCHHLLGLPNDYVQAWLKIRTKDTVTPRLIKSPGRAIIMLRNEAACGSTFKEFLENFQIAQAMCNVYVNFTDQICAHIALYRRHFLPSFSERDKHIIEQASKALLVGLSPKHMPLGALGNHDPMAALAGLTPKEREVCRQYAEGQTYKAIAVHLGISPFTVRHHLRSVYTKLNIRNKGEIAWLISRLST